MGKYHFAITEINPYTTHGKVLEKVPSGCTVLECGCANGYMTRFMKLNRGNVVDIVEIDPEDYREALTYARDGFCGDLNGNEWFVHYQNQRYDRILFADVLEHLLNPLKTVWMAKELLKPDGKIVFSIPNICHNDILIRMFNNEFSYTETGLLDSTHLRFWGLHNIPQFCERAELEIERIDAICIPTGQTEQKVDAKQVDTELLKLLEKRENGEVYQYVITCARKDGTT